MTETDGAQENGRQAPPGGPGVTAKPEARKGKRAPAQVQLESQDDLAYLTGQHGSKEAEKQVKSPAPRRPAKGKEATRSERR